MRRNHWMLAAAALAVAGWTAPLLGGEDVGGGREGTGGESLGPIEKGKDGAPHVVGRTVGGPDVPDLSLSFVMNDDGRTTVADHRGEVVIVDLWATTCGPCRGLIPTFSKEQDEFGKKGLVVFGVTGESRDVLVDFLAKSNTAEVTYKMASGSSGGLQSGGGVPYCFVVDVDGRVAWQGRGAPPGKVVEAELKRVKAPTAEMLADRANKALARAEALAGERAYLRAAELLERVVKQYPSTEAAKTATARLDGFKSDKAVASDLAAQKALAKILGGSVVPAEKLSKKDCKQKVAQIEALVKKEGDAAPGMAAQAKAWVDVLSKE